MLPVIGRKMIVEPDVLKYELSRLSENKGFEDSGLTIVKQAPILTDKDSQGKNIRLDDEKYRRDGQLPIDTMRERLLTHVDSDRTSPYYKKTAKEALELILKTPAYKNSNSDTLKIELLRKAYNKYKVEIREEVINENKLLKDMVNDSKEALRKIKSDRTLPLSSDRLSNLYLSDLINY